MTRQEITELADRAIKECLFEPLNPAIVVASDDDPKQVVIPHAFVYKFAELLFETTNMDQK